MSCRRRSALLLLMAIMLPGCRFDGMQFTSDHRVTWLTEDRSTVTLPLTLHWQLDGYQMVGADGSQDPDQGYVAIFIDQSPQKPFEPIEKVAADDDACLPAQGCPDDDWFNDRYIFPVYEGNTLVIDRLPLPRDTNRRELRNFTLVLLDGTGRRQGESAFAITLQIDRYPAGTTNGGSQ